MPGITKQLGKKEIDLTGQTLNRWRVDSRGERRPNGALTWNCTCLDCGQSRAVRADRLRSGRSCGCIAMAPLDRTGKTYGSWLVIARAAISGDSRVRWNCTCTKCGAVCLVSAKNLRQPTNCASGHHIGRPVVNMLGKHWGYRTVISESGRDARGHATWVVQCSACGGVRVLSGDEIRRPMPPECGCMKRVLSRYLH